MQGNKKFQTGIIPILLCLLATLLSSCGTTNSLTSSDQKASDDKQVLRYAMPVIQDFGTLDPALPQSAADAYAIQTLFTGLVKLDDNGNVKDQLAASHEISADGKTYTFHLKPNLKFSDGKPLTAEDVAYSINRTLLPATHSTVTSYLSLIEGYSDITSGKVPTLIGTKLTEPNKSLIVQDPQTISIKISKPASYFLQALTYPTSYVVEKSLIEKYGASWTDHLIEGGGAGPFKVKTYTHGKILSVVPNPHYYGSQPQLKEIDFIFSGDTATTYKAYKNHQYDFDNAVPATDLNDAKKRSDFYMTPSLSIRYLSFNYLAKPFNNSNIRKAFALAINKDILANNYAHGADTPTNHIVPQGMYGYNPNLTGPDGTTNTKGDQAQAVSLLNKGLQEEGYSSVNGLPPITLTSFKGNKLVEDLVNAIADQWKTVLKVSVKVNLLDFNTFNQAQTATTGNSNLQAWFAGWSADYPDPQDWLSVFFGQGEDYNNNNYGDPHNKDAAKQQQVQAGLDQADREQDTTKRAHEYNQLEQKLINDIAWVPIAQTQYRVVQNPKLHGFKQNALGITDPEDWGNIYFTS